MNQRFNRLNNTPEESSLRQEVINLLKYWKTEGVVVESPKGFYRLKTNKEIKKEIADTCK